MEITILSCLANANELRPELARLHDGKATDFVYIARKTRSACSRVNMKYSNCFICYEHCQGIKISKGYFESVHL
jgi:hypothetical protein